MTRYTPASTPMAPSHPDRMIAWARHQVAQHQRLAARAAGNPAAVAMHERHRDTALAVIATLTALRAADQRPRRTRYPRLATHIIPQEARP